MKVKVLCLAALGEASKASAALLPLMAQNSPDIVVGLRVPETVLMGSPSISVSHRFAMFACHDSSFFCRPCEVQLFWHCR